MNTVLGLLLLLATTFCFKLDAVAAPLTEDNSDLESEEVQDSEFIPPLVRHYIAKEGTEIKARDDLAEIAAKNLGYVKPDLTPLAEQLKSSASKIGATWQEKIKQRYDSLLPCFVNKTTRIDLDSGLGLDSKITITDYLFLTEDTLPAKYEGQFGDRVQILLYKFDDPTWPVHDVAKGMGVPCVPFRIRATAKYTYHHFGKEALRNFDEAVKGQVNKRGDRS